MGDDIAYKTNRYVVVEYGEAGEEIRCVGITSLLTPRTRYDMKPHVIAHVIRWPL